jgi:4-aminobutyrate aminotransferase
MPDLNRRAMAKTRALVERESALLADSLKVRFFPFAAERGEGSWLTDFDGNRYLDFTASWAVANTGYSHPRVVEAIARQAGLLSFSSLCSVPNQPETELAERLREIVPVRGEKKVWFGLSGSDANDFLAKMAPLATGRSKIVAFIGGYHGQTGGSAAISGHTAQAKAAGNGNVVKIPYPNPYRPLFGVEPAATGDAILNYLEDYLFRTICPPDQTAAIILEAIQSDGGDIVPPPGFLRGLRELCDRHGILLFLDEVKVGFGRTGLMFAFEHEGIEPDAVSLGKSLGGGLPVSAVVGRRDFLDAATANAMFTTAGNPVSAAAALASLDVIRDEALVERAGTVGARLHQGLKSLAERHELIGDVRGAGMIQGVELVADRGTKEPAAKAAHKVIFRAMKLGLLVFYGGILGNVLEITPPLILTEQECDLGLQILDQALADVAAGRVSDEALAEYVGW